MQFILLSAFSGYNTPFLVVNIILHMSLIKTYEWVSEVSYKFKAFDKVMMDQYSLKIFIISLNIVQTEMIQQ